LREQKNAPKVKKILFFKKKIKNDGLNEFLEHIFLILDDANHPPGHREIWAS
jgi:hypothetical protein